MFEQNIKKKDLTVCSIILTFKVMFYITTVFAEFNKALLFI